MVGILLFLVLVFGFLAFKPRVVHLALKYPSLDKPIPKDLELNFYEYAKEFEIPDYARQVVFDRYDIYGSDLSDQDFHITDQDGKKVPNPRTLMPGVYKLHIHKTGYKPEERPLAIGKVQQTVPVILEPNVEQSVSCVCSSTIPYSRVKSWNLMMFG